jgi:hypothetical protein
MSVEERPLTAAEIYAQINGGPGLDSLRESQVTLSRLHQLMENSAADVRALNSRISAGFQGRSGEAAANATRPLSKATDDDLDHLGMVDDSISAQITAFSTVRNSVQPVSPQPPQLTATETMEMLLGLHGGYEQKIGGWATDIGTNIKAFNAYYDASTTNSRNAPSQFGQVIDPGERITMAGAETPSTAKSVAPLPRSGGSLAPPPPPSAPQQVPVRSAPGLSEPVGPAANGDTTVSAYPPTGGGLPPGYRSGPTSPPTQPNISVGQGSGYFVSGTPDSYHGVAGPGAGGTSGRGAGTTGGRGAGPVNERGDLSAGLRSGAGEDRNNGRPSPIGSTGKVGRSGLPGIGTGAGKKDEDKERKRPGYLRNPDPKGTFTDPAPKTAPPVIGEH